MARRWTEAEDELVRTLTLREAARRIGVSHEWVRQRRIVLNRRVAERKRQQEAATTADLTSAIEMLHEFALLEDGGPVLEALETMLHLHRL